MKRPRGNERQKLLEELRAEVPWVRHAWELGRRRRRAQADLETILAGTVHTKIEPLRAGDPRVAHAQLDRQLQEKLREQGLHDEKGFIYGGMTLIAHRPFTYESIEPIRNALRAIDDAFMRVKFSSPLEHSAFTHAPKHAKDDDGPPSEEQWAEAWLQITSWQYPKAIACEAIGLKQKTYEERRRRPRGKSGGLSINDEEALAALDEMIAKEKESIENNVQYREYASRLAAERGLKLPKELRMPTYSKALRKQMPKDWRFYDDDRARWRAQLSKQPRKTQARWRTLIELREQRIAGAMAGLGIHEWIRVNVQKPTAENREEK